MSAGNKNEYHYDAHCFTAYLNNGSAFNDIYWIRAFNISNFHTLKKASFRIRDMYFKDFNDRQDVNDSSLYKYNLDDVRFWDGPIWKIMDDEKLKEWGLKMRKKPS